MKKSYKGRKETKEKTEKKAKTRKRGKKDKKEPTTTTTAPREGKMQFRTSRYQHVAGFRQVNVGGGIHWIYVKVGTAPIELWTGYNGQEYRCLVGGHGVEAGAPPAGWTLQPNVDMKSMKTKAVKSMKTKDMKSMKTKAVKAMKSMKTKAVKSMKTKAMKSLEWKSMLK